MALKLSAVVILFPWNFHFGEAHPPPFHNICVTMPITIAYYSYHNNYLTDVDIFVKMDLLVPF